MNGVTRFLSRREKKGKSSTLDGKHHHYHQHATKELSRILHCEDNEKRKPDKDDDKKVKEVLQRLQATSSTSTITQAQVEGSLRLPSINSNADKAFEFLMSVQDCLDGVLHDYNVNKKLVGAVNRENVTCYLDSLLFSMFARTDSFEGILTADYQDLERRRLVLLLRLWVNMLRTGKLITPDITEKLQESLKDCGWPEAALLRQQDVSEAFTFITGKLDLPLLTLKMDVYHTGKEDKDDHRIVRERLLDVAIPKPPEDGSAIRLEDCLESYFNNKIEVKRHLQRRNTVQSLRSIDKGQVLHVESLGLRPDSTSSTNSIFSHRRIETGEPSEYRTHDDISVHGTRRRASTIRREVSMPAWQFFSLIPWYTHEHPKNDKQVAVHLQTKRPVLGICLKRYSMTNQGVGTRLDTYIDIPLEIGLPHFISDDCGHADNEGYQPNFTNFKLSLLSVICHRGKSLDAGHYISLVRGDAANLPYSSTRPTYPPQPPQDSQLTRNTQATQLSRPTQLYETKPSAETIKFDHVKETSEEPLLPATNPIQVESQESIPLKTDEIPQDSIPKTQEPLWLRFDDLAKDRISHVDIHQALKDEVPYLLFYQVQPIEDDHMSERGDPPTYDEATIESSNMELSRILTESALTDASTILSVMETVPTRDSFLPTSKATIATYEVGAENPSLLAVEKIGRANSTVEPLRYSMSDPELPLRSPVLVDQPKADVPTDAARPKSIDLSHSALNPPAPVTRSSADDPLGRNSIQSNRASLAFTDPSTNGSHKGGSSAPITPGEETGSTSGFLSSSRRDSVSKGWLKTKSRPTSESGDNRLSLSMSRLRSAISKDKLGNPPPLSTENGSAVFPDGSPERRGSTTLHLENVVDAATKAHKKSGSFGRSRSLRHPYGEKKAKEKRSRSTGRNLEDGTDVPKGKGKKGTPERDCAVM